MLGDDVVRLSGGKGANQAAALAHLGADVSLIAAVGNDESGDWLRSELRAHGVRDDLMQRSTRPSGTAFITVDDHGENEVVVSPGANADLDLKGIDLGQFEVVLAQMEVASSVLDEAAASSRHFILNVAPARVVNPDTLARCDVVIANEVEAAFFDVTTLEHCVVTLGSRGAVHYQRGQEVARASAPEVVAVDTVGAGDVFCAAYALQWALGVPPIDALRFATTAGALATLALGAQGSLPTREEVDSWLARA